MIHSSSFPSCFSPSEIMDILDIFFALLFFIPHIYADCPVAICGNTICSNTDFAIRFPFRNAQVQPENCGYPGFNLTCNNQGIPVLKLPHSGEFWVRNINYVAQQIQLYDPNNCLPDRFLTGLNLSGSPFVAFTHQNYTFLSCPASFTKSRFTTIACLSNSTTSVMATPSPNVANSLSASMCRIITTLAVPVTGEFSTEDGISNNLELDLGLAWYEPFCSGCEVQGGTCQFKSNTNRDLVCNLNQTSGRANNGFQVFRIICVSITVPAITCAVGIACFACIKDRVPSTNAQRSSNAVAAEPEPQELSIVAMGLDQTTIESYQMLVLGESRRLPGPNDTTCAICLSEYLTKEAVRCIPECKHCFHADCVDEWLRMHSSCPVCRNNPSPAHVNSNGV